MEWSKENLLFKTHRNVVLAGFQVPMGIQIIIIIMNVRKIFNNLLILKKKK